MAGTKAPPLASGLIKKRSIQVVDEVIQIRTPGSYYPVLKILIRNPSDEVLQPFVAREAREETEVGDRATMRTDCRGQRGILLQTLLSSERCGVAVHIILEVWDAGLHHCSAITAKIAEVMAHITHSAELLTTCLLCRTPVMVLYNTAQRPGSPLKARVKGNVSFCADALPLHEGLSLPGFVVVRRARGHH